MPAQSTVLYPMPMATFDSSTLSGSYQAIGTPLPDEARIVKMVNTSTVPVVVSLNGTTNHDVIPVGGFFLYDVGTNRGNSSPLMCIQKGTQFYIKGNAGTGDIYLVAWFGLTPTVTAEYLPL
jgi:hypothetical protein